MFVNTLFLLFFYIILLAKQ